MGLFGEANTCRFVVHGVDGGTSAPLTTKFVELLLTNNEYSGCCCILIVVVVILGERPFLLCGFFSGEPFSFAEVQPPFRLKHTAEVRTLRHARKAAGESATHQNQK